MDDFILAPNPNDENLVKTVPAFDESGAEITIKVPVERPLTLFLNGQEIVTMMTIGDYPTYLAIGYLLNQNMLAADEHITAIDYDDELKVVVVRTDKRTNFEEKLRKKTLTSGCAQGTVFGDMMEKLDEITLSETVKFDTAWMIDLFKKITLQPSLYLTAGAIHGCVLCHENTPLIYMEDVGRHNAIDKLAGYMHHHHIKGDDKVLYTTGRLTSEMVIKTVQMGIPVLISRSGFTAWGVELAQKTNLTVIGRAKGSRFVVLSGRERLKFSTPRKSVMQDTSE